MSISLRFRTILAFALFALQVSESVSFAQNNLPPELCSPTFLWRQDSNIDGRFDIKVAPSGDARIIYDSEETTCFVQVLYKGKVYTQYEVSAYLGTVDIIDVAKVTSLKGIDYYIFMYGCGRHQMLDTIKAYKIENGKMIPASVFKTKKGLLSSISYEWRDGGGYEGVPVGCPGELLRSYFDGDTGTLYITDVETIDKDIYKPGKFLEYVFDGEYFVYKGLRYPGWLHPSVQGYKSIVALLMIYDRNDAPEYIIKIDSMPDGSYRYVAWKDNFILDYRDLEDEPILVLNKGEAYGEGYLFSSSDYEYFVVLDETVDGKGEIEVTRKSDGRIVLRRYLHYVFLD